MPDEHLQWDQFKTDHPGFPQLYHALFQLVPELVLSTDPKERADAVVLELMSASLPDFDDILLLCSMDRSWGAIKLLRGLFERTVTLKYLAENKDEIDAFLKYDAVDWDAVFSGIEKRFKITTEPKVTRYFHAAATEVKKQFKRCKECRKRQQNSWSLLDSVAMAEKVGLGYLHFECFVVPSKFIHPTYYGASQVSRAKPAPLENILKATHILTLETVLTHQRYFHVDPLATPAVTDAIQAFLKTWKFSETDFGLGKDAARAGIEFMPLPPPEAKVAG